MEDIEWIKSLRKDGKTIEDISLIVGMSRETIRKVIHDQLPDEIVLKEFHLCPYDMTKCHSFKDNLCSCGITSTQFFEKSGARKHPCPFFKEEKKWRREEVKRLSENENLTLAQIGEEIGLSASVVKIVYNELYSGRKRKPKKIKGV